MKHSRWIQLFLLIPLLGPLICAGETYVFEDVLYSGSTGSRGFGRSAISEDPVFHKYVMGDLSAPVEGERAGMNFRGEEVRWQRIEMDDAGVFQLERSFGGWIYLALDSKKEETVVLQSNGNSEILVNGVLRGGDIYSRGWMLLPMDLKEGRNEFWYRVSRGRNKGVSIAKPDKAVYLTALDPTLPDLLTHEIDEKWGAVRVVNAGKQTLRDLRIVSNVAGKTANTRARETVSPMTTRKIPFRLHDGANSPGKQAMEVSLYQGDRLIDQIVLELEIKEPTKQYRRTFFSEIDGSLQYYGVRQGRAETGRKPALFLSVHGANVKAIGQAGAYQNKDWGHVIAPTNRREFGFSWEDWGRLDAMEVLAHAENAYGTDPVRTYLTGHSMGGHGAWILGATYPDRWAAIAPMAGWRSFFSYGRSNEPAEPSPMETMLQRAANPSRTLELARNYLQHGVFIEHGEIDQTVPVSEARHMRELLGTFHPDFAYHEEPGGGHWYGVDHQRTFDFFRNRSLKDIRDLDVLEFRSASPGISATCRYITLYQQEESFEFCGVVAKQTIRSRRQRRFEEDITERKMEIDTENLKVFKIDLEHCRNLTRLTIEVDGQPMENLPWPGANEVWLEKRGEEWTLIDKPTDSREKNPKRYGGFKDAFRHGMLFVYSTNGSEEENTWSYNKARFDAETFYYRGNGAMDVIPDSEFTLQDTEDRSVILYGNASTNQAWPLLLEESPVQISRGLVQVGQRTLRGTGFGIYMVRPRKDSAVASVGVIAGTGLAGMRTVDPNRYFSAGTGYPDLLILTPETYERGIEGVKAAGYFGNDWSATNGSIVWNQRRGQTQNVNIAF